MAAVTLVTLLHGECLGAWKLARDCLPQRLAVHGEQLLKVDDIRGLDHACEDIDERLRGDGCGIVEWHWLADEAGRRLLASSKVLHQRHWRQVLDWQWLAERFALSDAAPRDLSTILEGELLPWLLAADADEEHRQQQQALQREHETESERLAAERIQLKQENERLRAQNTALRQVDAELLVSFLPALFPRVFTVVGATDLALLCGRIEPLGILNPYPEPSEETLRTLQRRFRALPQELQAQIVQFVSRLPHRHRLQPRPEVRDLVNELERDER